MVGWDENQCIFFGFPSLFPFPPPPTHTHVAVVGRRRQVFILLVGEDVDGDKVALGVAVLACEEEGGGVGGWGKSRRVGRSPSFARSLRSNQRPFAALAPGTPLPSSPRAPIGGVGPGAGAHQREGQRPLSAPLREKNTQPSLPPLLSPPPPPTHGSSAPLFQPPRSPVLDVDTSATLHGRPLMTRNPFLRTVPAC